MRVLFAIALVTISGCAIEPPDIWIPAPPAEPIEEDPDVRSKAVTLAISSLFTMDITDRRAIERQLQLTWESPMVNVETLRADRPKRSMIFDSVELRQQLVLNEGQHPKWSILTLRISPVRHCYSTRVLVFNFAPNYVANPYVQLHGASPEADYLETFEIAGKVVLLKYKKKSSTQACAFEIQVRQG
ncbi:MAG TPA: hypothetical protein VK629_21165 [Steroidobacteraceae bacterium]|nr:hypothetical protein [Steroidobacteraceae bacterium]